jgi:hypothetical protein
MRFNIDVINIDVTFTKRTGNNRNLGFGLMYPGKKDCMRPDEDKCDNLTTREDDYDQG